ncbi:aminopeptidase N [Moritella sp. 36]|uniref:aminopeptidase N n=1 Tax=Moritella sp. 36 TaxID=2746233 RepID=UPI001BA539AB|nr:aminopeptidase N [Moritella sp. 36]QUM89390.1 aminopeptidase N [Moritella sp. 36]
MTVMPSAKHLKDYTAPNYFIDNIDLDFNLDDSNTKIVAISKVRRSGSHNDPLILDGVDLTLLSVSIDGHRIDNYLVKDNQLIISDLPSECVLIIETEVNPQENTSLEGLYKSVDAFCTQCESEGFRKITYYLDRPDVLAVFSTKITADKAAFPYLLSNGNCVDRGELDNGRHWVQWRDPYPKPAYLFALVAGDFDVLRDNYITTSGRDVKLELFVDKGNLSRGHHAIESLKSSMKWDEDRFGLEYDLDIYMIVAVDFFNMGAMENKGLNVFNSKYVLADAASATDVDYLGIEAVIGHEYFHNWTGNRITCRDWFQLSLKEGLTVFRDQEFSSDLGSRAVNRIQNVKILRSAQFPEDAGPMAHPIRPASVIEMNNFYTATVYNKGAEVIRMIHTLLGEQNFRAGMDLYFKRHDGQAVTCDDFVASMQDASSVDLTLFKNWYSQSGTPQVTVTDHYDAESNIYTLSMQQHTPSTADQKVKQVLHIPVDIELLDAQGGKIELIFEGEGVHNILNLTEKQQDFVFENVMSAPVPSLFREFSAPVKLNYAYTNEQLTMLMVHASNDFARWDASQLLINKHVIENVTRIRDKQNLVLPAVFGQAFRDLVSNEELDPALKAEMLQFPSTNSLMGLFDEVDVDALLTVTAFIKAEIAVNVATTCASIYADMPKRAYEVEHAHIALRSLKNVCLEYISLAGVTHVNELVLAQFKQSDNMTDTMGAISAANKAQLPCFKTMMAAFETTWSHDGLVMDKWFSQIGASPSENCLSVVKNTLNHVSFSLANPNRTRSLVGSFSAHNTSAFHAIDGSGYVFLTDILCQLNSSNPQIASRLITPLIEFKKFDQTRQALMKAQLIRLSKLGGLATDLFEKIDRALA